MVKILILTNDKTEWIYKIQNWLGASAVMKRKDNIIHIVNGDYDIEINDKQIRYKKYLGRRFDGIYLDRWITDTDWEFLLPCAKRVGESRYGRIEDRTGGLRDVKGNFKGLNLYGQYY